VYLGAKANMYSAWKPLQGPVLDWPLAICDPNSTDPLLDYDSHDNVYADVVRENVMVFHNPRQRWHYLSGQMPSEILLFRQADSEGRTRKTTQITNCTVQCDANYSDIAVPHTAFDLPRHDGNAQIAPRESIEARVIICFRE
jgi:hypothetical protein